MFLIHLVIRPPRRLDLRGRSHFLYQTKYVAQKWPIQFQLDGRDTFRELRSGIGRGELFHYMDCTFCSSLVPYEVTKKLRIIVVPASRGRGYHRGDGECPYPCTVRDPHRFVDYPRDGKRPHLAAGGFSEYGHLVPERMIVRAAGGTWERRARFILASQAA